jgi:acyl carrier protein
MISKIRQIYQHWATAGERKVDAVFEGRSVLTDEAFYQHYFPDRSIPSEIVIGVRSAMIQHAPLDMRRLAPDDNFGSELQFVWSYDSLADVDLICEIEKRFDISISEAEGRETLTMSDLIRLVDRKVRDKNKEANQPVQTRPTSRPV